MGEECMVKATIIAACGAISVGSVAPVSTDFLGGGTRFYQQMNVEKTTQEEA